MITLQETLNLIDRIIQPERLNSVQELVFTECWQGKTYQEIADDSGYDPDYIRVVGSRLWQNLSDRLGEKITKNNFKSALRQQLGTTENFGGSHFSLGALELPNTPVPLDSPLYVQRPPIETQAYEEIIKPGALIRIQAPKHMGKTSLMMRILAQAKVKGYYTVRLNFQQAEESILTDLNKLLRWLCANITLQLGIESALDDYWDEDLGVKVSCTTYLQGYVLGQLDSPLVLVLDEVNRLFKYIHTAQEFLPLLRFWHEESNNIAAWQKLRLIVVHSTEIYVALNIHQSPFNVGLALKLAGFNLEQFQELLRRYDLSEGEKSLNSQELEKLHQLLDGFPYLLNLALYNLATDQLSLPELLKNIATESSIYTDHLRNLLVILNEHSELKQAYKQVVNSPIPIKLDSIITYELENMALIKIQGNEVTPRCELYRLYFCDRL
jgi:AAA+ ATPase superfamily predicted ATPase